MKTRTVEKLIKQINRTDGFVRMLKDLTQTGLVVSVVAAFFLAFAGALYLGGGTQLLGLTKVYAVCLTLALVATYVVKAVCLMVESRGDMVKTILVEDLEAASDPYILSLRKDL